MALHHSTEYNINGGAWILAYADEVAGSGKSLVPTGAVNGDIIRLRITPLTGGGSAIVSDPVVYVVPAGADVHQIQFVQTQLSYGLSGYIGVAVQSQLQTQQNEAALQFVGNVVEIQNIQSHQISAPNLDSNGVAYQNQLIQTENIISSVIYYATVSNNQALQIEQANSAINLTGVINESQVVQTENIESYVVFTSVVSQNQLINSSNSIGSAVANSPPYFTQQPTITSVSTNNIVFAYGTADDQGDLYYREVSKNSGNSWEQGAFHESPGAGKSITLSSLTAGTTYYIFVRLTGETGNTTSVLSDMLTVVTVCAAPSLSASAGNAQNVLTMSALGATSYNIYYTTDGSTPTLASTKIAGVSSPYTHPSLVNGTTYKYIATAVNTSGESAASAVVSATPAAYPIALANGATVALTGGNAVAYKAGTASISQTAADSFSFTGTGTNDSAFIRIGSAASTFTWAATYVSATTTNIQVPLVGVAGSAVTPNESYSYTNIVDNRKVMVMVSKTASNIALAIYYFDTSNVIHYWNGSSWVTSDPLLTLTSGTTIKATVARDATNYTITVINASTLAALYSATIAVSTVRLSGNDWVFTGDPASTGTALWNVTWACKINQVS